MAGVALLILAGGLLAAAWQLKSDEVHQCLQSKDAGDVTFRNCSLVWGSHAFPYVFGFLLFPLGSVVSVVGLLVRPKQHPSGAGNATN